MWKSIFNVATIILILLFFTACQSSVKFSKDYSRKSAINSQERFHKKQTLHENTIKEKWISQKQKEHKFRESLQSYIGLKHPPLPDDLKRRGSLLVGTGDASEYPYVVNLIEKNEKYMMWLELLISLDNSGKAVSKVVDVVALPAFDKNYEIITGGSSDRCSVNGEYDPNLIALAELEDENTEYFTKIRKAWRVEPTAGKFKSVSLKSLQIQCQNVNFGI